MIFNLQVSFSRIRKEARYIDLYGVIDNKVDRDLRINSARISSHLHHRISEGSNVNHGRHSCEVL